MFWPLRNKEEHREQAYEGMRQVSHSARDKLSLFALHDVLEEPDLECWSLFVQACQLLVTPMLTGDEAKKGHKLLVEFCSIFEHLCGSTKLPMTSYMTPQLVLLGMSLCNIIWLTF